MAPTGERASGLQKVAIIQKPSSSNRDSGRLGECEDDFGEEEEEEEEEGGNHGGSGRAGGGGGGRGGGGGEGRQGERGGGGGGRRRNKVGKRPSCIKKDRVPWLLPAHS